MAHPPHLPVPVTPRARGAAAARLAAVSLVLAGAGPGLAATAPLLRNPSFEDGPGAPDGWQPSSPEASAAEGIARTGRRSILVRGKATTSSHWLSEEIAVGPGCYRFTFWARQAPGTTGGCIVSGPPFMNRDLQVGEDWTRRGFVFPLPPGRSQLRLRLGLWHKEGTVWFDDASLTRCVPVARRVGERVFGAGESAEGSRYRFAPDLGGEGSGYARPLRGFTCGFNSNRWTFGPGQWLVYRHAIPRVGQRAARVTVGVGYHTRGACVVEVSRDGRTWTRIGAIAAVDTKTFPVPSDLLPAPAIEVRLRSPARAEVGAAPGSFQVYTYRYEADLDADLGSIEGRTRFAAIEEDALPARVEILDLGDLSPGGRNRVRLRVTSSGARAGGKARVEVRAGREVVFRGKPVFFAEGAGRPLPIELPYRVPDRGDYELALSLAGRGGAFRARVAFRVPSLHATGYGYALADDDAAAWWWCEGPFKVSRTRPAPPRSTRTDGIRVEAARGEMESLQIVLRPKRALRAVTFRVLPEGPGPSPEVYEIARVAYLYVRVPTDASGCRGWWPDPLDRLKGPIDIAPDRNQPIWITLRIPRDLRAGDHRMAIEAREGDRALARFPLTVHVFDYAIPARRHLATAFGLSAGRIHQYHNLEREEDRRRVWDLYMQNFRDHRMAPYDFAPYDPIRTTFTGLSWRGGRRIQEGAATGAACLRIADDSPREVVSSEYAERIPVDPRRPYELRFRARVDREGRRYMVTLATYDETGRWIPGHNIDLAFEGSASWREERVRIVPAERSPRARSVGLVLRPTVWTEGGEGRGEAWFDDVFFGPAGSGRNLVRNGGFEAREALRPEIDFARWDAQAARYLDRYGFDGFRLHLQGLGGGTFHSRHEGRIEGYRQGTPAYRRLFGLYARAIQEHLRARGWLAKAYIYWFDEPAPKDYAFVRAGMEEIHRAAPDLRRMLTEEPRPALVGAVDIWCPVLHNASPEAVRGRLDAGEDVWWYVCTGPKAPYPGLFIDHDGIELRIWLWMTWKYGVRGILVWSANYWTSPCAFAREPQNPWRDPMGYQSGYGRPAGYIGYWGNGDGRFLYPANRDVRGDRRPYIEGPANSIRWEMLREGIEDYETFRLLRDLLERARRAGVPEVEVREAEALLRIPAGIIRDRTHFTRDPRDLDGYRRKVARAIEGLARRLAR